MLHNVQAAGIRQRVFEAGRGPVVLLVHGFPLDHSMWREQLPALAAKHRVVAPDLRGLGGSDVTPGKVMMAQFADDLAALLDALAIDEPVAYCGLSMGGYIAWPFWQKHRRRVRSLVLCDTRSLPDTAEAARGRLQTAEIVLRDGGGTLPPAMIPKLFSPATLQRAPQVIDACREMIERAPAEGIAAALRGMAERPDSTPLLATIDVPTLAVCGEEDGIAPPSEMRAIAEQIPGGRYVEIAGAGHMAPWEQPAAFNAALLDFLAG